ncbi:MAG: hypothetical protein D6826_04155, partial [Alphaproteobacteria bacterium]
ALRLRAQIFSMQQDWAAAAAAWRRLVPETPPQRPLSEEESRDVVNLAIALTMAGARDDLIALNRDWGAAMTGSPDRETFLLLAGGLDPTRPKTIADELAEVAQAEAFLSRYQSVYGQAVQQATSPQAN